MKALYTNEKDCQGLNIVYNDLKNWDYDTRYQALKDNCKYVHLFKTLINDGDEVNCKYYSTMLL